MTIQRVGILILAVVLAFRPAAAHTAGRKAARPAASASLSVIQAGGLGNGSIDFVKRIGGRYEWMQEVGTTAYLLGGHSLLSVDVANRAQPVIRDRIFMPVTGDFRIHNGFIYVLHPWEAEAVSIVDIRDPDNIRLAGTYPASGPMADWIVTEWDIQGQYLYALTRKADDYSGALTLRILDLFDPTNLRELSALELGAFGKYLNAKLAVGNGYAFVSFFDEPTSGITVINVADPSAPTNAGDLITIQTRYFDKLWVEGQRLYVAYYRPWLNESRLDIHSLAAPEQPVKLGTLNFSDIVAIDGFDAYVRTAAGSVRSISPIRPPRWSGN